MRSATAADVSTARMRPGNLGQRNRTIIVAMPIFAEVVITLQAAHRTSILETNSAGTRDLQAKDVLQLASSDNDRYPDGKPVDDKPGTSNQISRAKVSRNKQDQPRYERGDNDHHSRAFSTITQRYDDDNERYRPTDLHPTSAQKRYKEACDDGGHKARWDRR
jgi:hypothetical protein